MFKQYQLLFLLALCASCPVSAMELQNAVPADELAVEQKNNDEQLPSLDRRGMRDLFDKKIQGYDFPGELESKLAAHLMKTCDPGFMDFSNIIVPPAFWRIRTRSDCFYYNTKPLMSADNTRILVPSAFLINNNESYGCHIFDIQGKHLCTLRSQSRQHAWSSDNKYIASCDIFSGIVAVWNAETGDMVKQLTTYDHNPFRPLLFRPNTHQIIAANREQKRLDIWDIESGSCVENIPLDQDFACTFLSCDSRGRYLLIGGVMGSGVWECTCATLWDLERHQTVHRLSFSANNDAHCTAIAWSDNGQMLAIATIGCEAIAWSDNGQMLTFATLEGNITNNTTIQVYNIETAECIKDITAKQPGWIDSISWLCNDTILAVAQKKTQSIAFWAPFSKNHSQDFFTTFNMQGGDLGLDKAADCTVNCNRCAILYDSRNGSFLMKVFDFSAIEQIYDYLYNGKIFFDQAMLLTAIENSKLNCKKYALDRESKKIFDRLPEEIQRVYMNHVLQQPWYYYTTLYKAAEQCVGKARQTFDQVIDDMRIG